MPESRYWYISRPDTISLPAKESILGIDQGGTLWLYPIVDEKYGGVIAWANTIAQAARIVEALENHDE